MLAMELPFFGVFFFGNFNKKFKIRPKIYVFEYSLQPLSLCRLLQQVAFI